MLQVGPVLCPAVSRYYVSGHKVVHRQEKSSVCSEFKGKSIKGGLVKPLLTRFLFRGRICDVQQNILVVEIRCQYDFGRKLCSTSRVETHSGSRLHRFELIVRDDSRIMRF